MAHYFMLFYKKTWSTCCFIKKQYIVKIKESFFFNNISDRGVNMKKLITYDIVRYLVAGIMIVCAVAAAIAVSGLVVDDSILALDENREFSFLWCRLTK